MRTWALLLLLLLGLNVVAQRGRSDDVYIEDDNLLRRSYRLEDFLWTGSGDGDINGYPENHSGDGGYLEPSPRPLPPWRTTTVFRTTTVLSTAMPPTSPMWPQSQPSGVVRPTPTVRWPGASPPSTTWTSEKDNDLDNDLDEPPEPRFWLLTVVQSNASNMWPFTPEGLEARLARLYRKAFLRQQERHLGITAGMSPYGPTPYELTRTMRSPRGTDSLRVTIHNVTLPSGTNGETKILYWVWFGGKPVPATAAARDMRLVSDAEVSAELGLPVVTKAEPFLKPPVPMAARGRARDTWILVAATAAAAVIVALLALLGLALTQRQRQRRRRRRQQLQQRAQETAADNAAFQVDTADTPDAPSLKGTQAIGSGPTAVAVPIAAPRRRRRSRSHSTDSHLSGEISSAGSLSGSADSSGDAPLVRPRGRPPEKAPASSRVPSQQPKHHRRRHRHKDTRTVDTVNTALVGNVQPDQEDRAAPTPSKVEEPQREKGRAQRGAVSPTSYLSMPSVKAFPRAAPQPEPLARVLGPSSNHLVDDDAVRQDTKKAESGGLHGVRHSSLEGDPGVLGPVVWGLRCQRMKSAGSAGSTGDVSFSDGVAGAPTHSLSPSTPELPSPVGAAPGRMRRRFHELLDDALSLFGGSRSSSQEDDDDRVRTGPLSDADPRVQSALVRPVGAHHLDGPPRPKTTGARRPATARDGVSVRSSPRGAWSTAETSPTSGGVAPGSAGMRPLSAGPFHRPSLPVNSSQQPVMDPVVDSALVLADARLPPTDPAVPLIAAIKRELSRFGGTDGGGGGGRGGGGVGGCGPGMFGPPLPGSAAVGD